MKNLLTLIGFTIVLGSKMAFANGGDMIRSGGMMMGGGHMGGFMWLFGLLYLAGIILFFWLLFRIVRALERIAQSKEKE